MSVKRTVNIDFRSNGANFKAEMRQMSQAVAVQGEKMASSAKKTGRAMRNMGNSAGLAGASAMALGGALSDMQYGLRGVANNLQQFVAMFGMLTTSSGGFKGALKDLRKAMMGPIGVVIAIQTVISVIGIVQDKMRKARKEAQKFSSEVGAQRTELSAYASIVTDGNAALSTRQGALDKLKKAMPQLYDLTLDQVDAEQRLTDAIIANAKAEAAREAVKSLTKQIAELEDKFAQAGKKGPNLFNKFLDLMTGTAAGTANWGESLSSTNQEIADLTIELNKAASVVAEYDEATRKANESARDAAKLAKEAAARAKFKATVELDASGLTGLNQKVGELGEAQIIAQTKALESLQKAWFDAHQEMREYAGTLTYLEIKTEDDINNAVDKLKNLGDVISDHVTAAAIDMGNALAESFSKGDATPIGQALLTSIAGFLNTLGQLMIAAGISLFEFQASMLTFNPFLMIGAGVAAIAAAALVKSYAKGMSAVGSGGGGSSTAPGASFGGSESMSVQVRGEDLYIALERVNQRKNRGR